jgi:hypothetical protein
MPTRASKKKRPWPRDTNQLPWQIVQEATGQAPPEEEQEDTRNPAAVAVSKLGGVKRGEGSCGEALQPREVHGGNADAR